jgi:uncharacterized protein YpmS
MNWKRLFFLLLGLNAAVLIILAVLINLPVEDSNVSNRKASEEDYVPFYMETNKEDLNRIINYYVEKENNGAFQYEILLTDEVELHGKLPVFNNVIEMKLTFEPKAQENGDLVLEQTNMSIGKLNLPAPLILKFVKDSYHMPKGVTIQPNEKRIHLSLQDINQDSKMKVRINEFNLKKDDINFTLLVPTNE